MGKVHRSEINEILYIEKEGEKELLVSSDEGLIKFFKQKDDGEFQQRRSFLVNEKGISCLTPLLGNDSLAIATYDNQIVLFSVVTGTTMRSFFAHDNTISGVCSNSESLVTGSHDTTIKIWSL